MEEIPDSKKGGTYNFLGDIYCNFGEINKAVECYTKAEKIVEERKEKNNLGKPYAEIREILKAMGPDYTDKLPKWVLELIETSYSRLYKVPFKGKEWMDKSTKLLDDTKVILTIFNLQYWSNKEQRTEYVEQYKKTLGKE